MTTFNKSRNHALWAHLWAGAETATRATVGQATADIATDVTGAGRGTRGCELPLEWVTQLVMLLGDGQFKEWQPMRSQHRWILGGPHWIAVFQPFVELCVTQHPPGTCSNWLSSFLFHSFPERGGHKNPTAVNAQTWSRRVCRHKIAGLLLKNLAITISACDDVLTVARPR